ncbi:MAG: hypothetical protein V4671_31830 [Armatimonadota bacterium]
MSTKSAESTVSASAFASASALPALIAGEVRFLLFTYNWNHSKDRDNDSVRSFATLQEAEQAYAGTQNAAEVAVVQNGELRVISRSAAGSPNNPRTIQWRRDQDWPDWAL